MFLDRVEALQTSRERLMAEQNKKNGGLWHRHVIGSEAEGLPMPAL